MKTLIRNFLSVLRRFKMATVLNVAGLAVAFAAFIVIMIQLDYDWNFAKCYPDYDRIYRLEQVNEQGAMTILSRPMSELFINSSPHITAGTIVALSSKRDMFFSINKNGEKIQYREPSLKVSPNYGDVLEFTMIEGTANVITEPEKVLIPYNMSKKLFGDEPAIGKQLITDEKTYTIGGVYKDFPANTLVENVIYYPLPADEHKDDWNNSIFNTYIRLDSPQNSQHLVDNFNNTTNYSFLGDGYGWLDNVSLRLTPLEDIHYIADVQFDFTPKTSRQTLFVLFTIAFIILLIAGINFTNFSTALAPMRIKSINTQKVLGAGDKSLRMALLTEALLTSTLSYILSLVLVYCFSISPLVSLTNANVGLSSHPALLVVTFLIAILTGGLAGIYPSYYTTSFSPALVLKGSFGLSPKGRSLRNTLISVQFCASFALIICAIFIYLQNNFMQNTSLGYEKDQLIVSDVPSDMMKNKNMYVNQLKSFADIEDVTFSEMLISSSDQYMDWGRYHRGRQISFQCLLVDPSFLSVLGIDVLEGRNFREDDERTDYGTLIFNQKAKEAYELSLGEKIDQMEIIGFIPDIKFASFRTEVVPMAFYVWGNSRFIPEGMLDNYVYIKVKKGSNMHAAISHVKTTLGSLEPDYQFNIRFYDEVINGLYISERRFSSLIILFSLIAVFISIVGVFGLVVFDSEYRRKEIGIRKVLGSTVREIILLFNKAYVRILCICFVFSVPIAWYAVSKWLENFAYKTPMFWWVYLIAFLLVSLITTSTVTFQNWRVANANPVDSIKTE